MLKLDASKSGSFRIGGEIEVNRLGFGAMRLTGPGIWGPPADRAEAIRTLKRVPELGINFIDTADSYGPNVSEQLIREALYPYDGILIATKAGLRRPNPGQWEPDGRPEYLRQQAIKSRETLGLEQIGLWQLHRIDPRVSRDEQFAAVKSLQDEGIIRHAGLSNVSVEDIEAASETFKVATVQNRYNLVDRGSEEDDGSRPAPAVREDHDRVPGSGHDVGVGQHLVRPDREAGAGDDAVAADADALDLDRCQPRPLNPGRVDLGWQGRGRPEDRLQAREGRREGDA